MNRRAFLAGLTAAAAGLLIPERKVWALDRTMIPATPDWLAAVRETDTPLSFFGHFPVIGDYNYWQQFWVREETLRGLSSDGAEYATLDGVNWIRVG
jgi:hypothetical protein